MYDQNLQITREGSVWRVANPYWPTAPAPDAPNRSRAILTVLPAAIVIGTLCVLLIDQPAARTLVAILAVTITIALVEYLFRVRSERLQEDRTAADAALEATLGPAQYSRADFRDPDLRNLADRAVTAAGAITGSTAFATGTMGPQQTIADDLRVALWDSLDSLADLDGRTAQWRQAQAQIDEHSGEDYRDLSERVRQELANDTSDAEQQVQDLEDVAHSVADVDSRLAESTIDTHLENTLAGRPPARDEFPLLRLRAQIDSAHEVLDARGHSTRDLSAPKPGQRPAIEPHKRDSGTDKGEPLPG